jgi:hypothetical protein
LSYIFAAVLIPFAVSSAPVLIPLAASTAPSPIVPVAFEIPFPISFPTFVCPILPAKYEPPPIIVPIPAAANTLNPPVSCC